MPTSFDLSHLNGLRSLARVLGALNSATGDLADRMLIIGATARDLILHHVHRFPIRRATADLDLAVAIGSWHTFDALERRLIDSGAGRHAQIDHRFTMNDWNIDIVPFGGVEQNGTIVWPKTETQMSVTGFDEASRHALEVQLPEGVRAFVASPAALLILKLIAWDERHMRQPRHDAVDIRTLLDSYAAPWNEERLYLEADDLLQQFAYDNPLAAAALLGRDAGAIAEKATLRRILDIVEREAITDALALAVDMGRTTEHNLALLEALRAGLQDAALSRR